MSFITLLQHLLLIFKHLVIYCSYYLYVSVIEISGDCDNDNDNDNDNENNFIAMNYIDHIIGDVQASS